MKHTFTKSTLALSLLLSLSATQLKANIVYTDVNPDSVANGNSTITFDVDNDGTKDFKISTVQSGNFGFIINQSGQVGVNNFVLSDNSNNTLALALNTPINSSSTTWHIMTSTNSIMSTMTNGAVTGTWAAANDLYLGLKFITGGNTYYGWARFTVGKTTITATLKDYAYEKTPNTQILAGMMTTGIDKNVMDVKAIHVYPNPASSKITFQMPNSSMDCHLTLSDLSGREVMQITIPANTTSYELNVADLAKGMYFYTLSNNEAIESGKLEITPQQ